MMLYDYNLIYINFTIGTSIKYVPCLEHIANFNFIWQEYILVYYMLRTKMSYYLARIRMRYLETFWCNEHPNFRLVNSNKFHPCNIEIRMKSQNEICKKI